MKIIHTLSQYMGYVATGVLGLMMLLTVADVFMRYVFNSPITGTTELTEFMMVIAVFLALAWCAVKRAHVKVDLLMSHLPPRVQAIVDSITMLAALGLYIIITWQSFLESAQVATKTYLLKVPDFPFYWILSYGFAVLCLAVITILIENIAKAVKR